MAAPAFRGMLAAATYEGDDLVGLHLLDDFRLHRSARHQRGANLRPVAAQHQDLIEFDRIAGLGRQFFHPQHVAGLHPVLFAAGLHDRIHRAILSLAPFGPRFRLFVRQVPRPGQRAPTGAVSMTNAGR
jgi:hypothetical protein